MAIEHKKILEGIIIKDAADQSKQLQIEVGASASTATKTILEATQTSNITLSLPSTTDTLVGRETTDALTNKTIDADATGNIISNLADANIKTGAAINAAKIADGSVSSTEFQYLSGVTSDIQTQLNTGATGLSDHLSDTTDAHDASAISNIPSGNLAATDLQAAVNELQSDIDNRLLKAGDTMSGTLNMGANAVTSSYTPVSGSDLTNKTYVDGIAAGLDPKESVRVATTASVGGSYATTPSNGRFTGAATSVDGVSLSVNDRVLIKDQVDQKQNGIYVYSASGEFTRSSDMDGSPASEVSGGNFVFVAEGSTNSASGYVLIANGLVTLNTDNLVFTQFSGGANSANKTLSNLDSPTSINQDLIPSASGTRNLGSTSRIWSTQYINNLNDSSDNTSVDVAARILRRGAGVQMFNWANAGELSAVNNKIINVANPTGLLHAENKQSVQTLLQNFIPDGDAEGAQILTVYNDSSTTRPVDGNGGTQANLAVSISSSSPLVGTNSFLFSKTGSASTQGSGASIPFTIDNTYKAKVLQIEFDYIVNSGTFVAGSSSAESDVIVYIYDVTNSTLIEPSSIKLLSNSSTISDKYVANFQSSATGTSYRLIFHCQSTSASNYELKLDNISVSPSKYVFGTPITDWASYTPTITSNQGSIVAGALLGKYRRVGDSLEIEVKYDYASGTGGAGDIGFSLPSGLSIDSTKYSSSSSGFGYGYYYTNATGFKETTVRQNGPTSFALTNQNVGALLKGTDLDESGTAVAIRAIFPITGWSSSVQVSDGYDGRLIAAFAHRASTSQNINSASDIKIQWNGKTKDTAASFDSTTNYRFTAPSQGIYRHSGVVILDPSSSNIATLHLYKNGSQNKYLGSATTSATVSTSIPFSFELDANAGDYFELYLNSNSASQNVVSDVSAYGGSQWYISKLQAPTTISATEVVAARYSRGATQTIANTTVVPILWDTKSHDTHNAYNTSNGRFTAPISGLYAVSATILYDSGSWSAATPIEIRLYKNISNHISGTVLYPSTYTGQAGFSFKDDIQLNAGDTVEIATVQYSGANRDILNNTTLNFFSISRIK